MEDKRKEKRRKAMQRNKKHSQEKARKENFEIESKEKF